MVIKSVTYSSADAIGADNASSNGQLNQTVSKYLWKVSNVHVNAVNMHVRGHLSISLLPISSPTLHLFICIPPPHLCTIFKDHTQGRQLLGPIV
jgi:hypothetical protein